MAIVAPDAEGGTDVVWVDDLVAGLPLSRFAAAVLVFCIAAAMTEGYDTTAMALAAPMIAKAWALTPQQTGMLLSGSVVGVVVGSLLLSPLGDRWGRRPAILLGLSGAAVATFLGGVAPDFASLLASRLAAGLSLGLAFANVIALSMEFMPARLRTLAVVLVNCGYPFGSAVGGVIAAQLTPAYGFKVIFFVGGSATALIVALALLGLPESPLFLARRPEAHARVRALLQRLKVPAIAPYARYAVHAAGEARSPVAALFVPERRLATTLLWIINLTNMAMAYYMFTWLPSIVAVKGTTPQVTILAISIFSMGGVIGGITMALLLSRLGPTRVLAAAYVVAIATTVGLTRLGAVDGLFLATLALVGAATGGSQFCLNAVVNQFYPSVMRATAAGYATGIGRIGAIVAPAVGVAIMSNPALAPHALAAPAIPAALALAALLLLQAKTSYAQAMTVAR